MVRAFYSEKPLTETRNEHGKLWMLKETGADLRGGGVLGSSRASAIGVAKKYVWLKI
jgi:hypothetical protein